MAMKWTEAFEAIADARQTLSRADKLRRALADLLAGNLRASRVDGVTLALLKMELRDWNMRTGTWK